MSRKLVIESLLPAMRNHALNMIIQGFRESRENAAKQRGQDDQQQKPNDDSKTEG